MWLDLNFKNTDFVSLDEMIPSARKSNNHDYFQEVRFKRYEFNYMLIIYIRICFREVWSLKTLGDKNKYEQFTISSISHFEFENECL